MRNLIRRWLGLEHDLQLRDQMISSLREVLTGALRDQSDGDPAAVRLDRINASLCDNLNMIGEQLANIRLAIDEAAQPAEPEIGNPSECPNGHGALMDMAVLVESDRVTGARRVCGHGYFCPKCERSFFQVYGKRAETWSRDPNTISPGDAAAAAGGGSERTPPAPPRLRFRR